MSLEIPADLAPWRLRLVRLTEARAFQAILIALILFNAILLGLETSASVMQTWGPMILAIDGAILAVFVVEIVLRLLAHGPRFFKDPWSVFDFIVVGIALVPAAGPFSVLRALRVLRVLRLLTIAPNMRRVVGGLLRAVPGLTSVFGVMIIIYYVCAVIATKLFGTAFPDWFGDLGASIYTLFQIMTLESWSMGIARPVMEVFPYAWIFFMVFILVSTFTMLNLFIAVIVNAIQSEELTEAHVLVNPPHHGHDEKAQAQAELQAELSALRQEIAGLKALLQSDIGKPDRSGAG